ncbi:MAG: GNAT family N-acetyltransferase [Raoultibacter sp.]
MDLPQLIKVKPEQTGLIDQLAHMMGKSFLEEVWTREWLAVLPENRARKLAIACSIMNSNFTLGAPYQACWVTPDLSACAGGYRKSDLGEIIWNDLEDQSFELLRATILSEKEAHLLAAQALKMESISNFKWVEDFAAGSDFLHFYALGVDTEKRGSGAFRRLVEPFFTYADTHDIPCFLETYSDRLEALYAHFGFKTVKVLSDPAFAITQRCMIRLPQA